MIDGINAADRLAEQIKAPATDAMAQALELAQDVMDGFAADITPQGVWDLAKALIASQGATQALTSGDARAGAEPCEPNDWADLHEPAHLMNASRKL